MNSIQQETVLSVNDGSVLWITLNRASSKNAIDEDVVRGLEAALDVAEREMVTVVVLRGAGGNLSTGADLRMVLDLLDRDEEALVAYAERLDAVARRLERGRFVSVCVVEGFALAAGYELLLACDISVASLDANIGDRHLEYGLPVGTGAVEAARARPWAKLRHLLLTGGVVSGAEASSLGIVSHAVERDVLEPTVAELVERLRTRSPDAIRMTKAMLNSDQPADRSLFVQHLTKSDDVREGLVAFVRRAH